jgi:aspartyl-tRNA(Asn)/glutamyl-tRNA(Gln) amidotransferase subunit A
MTSGFADPIVAAGVAGLTGLFAAGRLDPARALTAYLARIERLNPSLNAFLAIDHDGARRDAEASRARWATGAPRSPIDGVPIAVKANIAVEGLAWHAGLGALRDRVAERDADCVGRLRAAGAVIVGVLNMHEAALGATNDNLVFGRCHNPYRRDFTPGGSSGGSAAAVAAGLCAAALGTDTLGSVRIPAAYCGVFGHKPAHGWASMDGITPLAPSLDALGLLTRDAADAALLARILTPRSEGSPASALGELRCAALDLSDRSDIDPATRRAFDQVVESAAASGVRVEPLRLAGWNWTTMRRVSLVLVEIEAAAGLGDLLARDPEGFSPALAGMLRWAQGQPADKVSKVHHDLAQAAASLRTSLSRFDGLLTPASVGPAFGFGEPPPGQADFTLPANVAGWAATAFPIGLSDDGLPLAAQVISADGDIALDLAERLARPTPPPGGFEV